MLRLLLALCAPIGIAARLFSCESAPAGSLTGLLVGQTGWGKSTVIDMVAGGLPLAVESATVGSSTTEETTCYAFDFLKNINPRIQNRTWRLIDTPGLSDVLGPQKDIINQQEMTAKLGEFGEVDVVILVWDITVKITSDVANSISIVRQALGPRFWSKLVILYTFVSWGTFSFSWNTFPPAYKVDCTVTPPGFTADPNTNPFHTQVVAGIQNYMTNDLGVPEPNCWPESTPDDVCVPGPDTVPYVAMGITMNSFSNGMTAEMLLNPGSQRNKQFGVCPTTDALQFETLFNKTETMKSKYWRGRPVEPLPVGIPNAFVECSLALAALKRAKVPRAVPDLNGLAHNISNYMATCFSFEMKKYPPMFEEALSVVPDFQPRLAFQLRDLDRTNKAFDKAFGESALTLVKTENGFNDMQLATRVSMYPDFDTYETCESDKIYCYQKIDAHCKTKTNELVLNMCRATLEKLSGANVCKCPVLEDRFHNSWACSLDQFDGSCPSSEACTESIFAASLLKRAALPCTEGATCGSKGKFTCSNTGQYSPERNTFYQCAGTTCKQGECCQDCVSTYYVEKGLNCRVGDFKTCYECGKCMHTWTTVDAAAYGKTETNSHSQALYDCDRCCRPGFSAASLAETPERVEQSQWREVSLGVVSLGMVSLGMALLCIVFSMRQPPPTISTTPLLSSS